MTKPFTFLFDNLVLIMHLHGCLLTLLSLGAFKSSFHIQAFKQHNDNFELVGGEEKYTFK